MTLTIDIQKSKVLKPKPNVEKLGFGKFFSDHMFVSNYNHQFGWHNHQIRAYANLQIDPAASSLHYGQALFEGLKAFRQPNGEARIFRPEFNWLRMRAGADRLCMQSPTEELFMKGIQQLVKIDQDWIPEAEGASLYIRPTLIGTEGFLGVRPSEQYTFFVILSPVGSYYAEGVSPIKIWIEDKFTRAVNGGLGATKAAANYATSLRAAQEAKSKGYAQVLWLDSTKSYVEEVGTMNVFFVLDSEIVTPELDGTILERGNA